MVLPEGVKVCLGLVEQKWKILLISEFKNDWFDRCNEYQEVEVCGDGVPVQVSLEFGLKQFCASNQHKGIPLLDVLVKNDVPPNIRVYLLSQHYLIHFIVSGGRSYRLWNAEASALLNGLANIPSIVVVCSNVICNTLHCCYIAVCLLVVRAIKY